MRLSVVLLHHDVGAVSTGSEPLWGLRDNVHAHNVAARPPATTLARVSICQRIAQHPAVHSSTAAMCNSWPSLWCRRTRQPRLPMHLTSNARAGISRYDCTRVIGVGAVEIDQRVRRIAEVNYAWLHVLQGVVEVGKTTVLAAAHIIGPLVFDVLCVCSGASRPSVDASISRSTLRRQPWDVRWRRKLSPLLPTAEASPCVRDNVLHTALWKAGTWRGLAFLSDDVNAL